MGDTWFNSRMFGSGVVSRKDLFELMMRHKPTDNGDGSKERYAYIEWLGIYHAIRELPSADRPQGEWIDIGWKGDWQFETDGRGNCWYEYECSECGFHSKGSKSNFCPNCGCRMKGADDE